MYQALAACVNVHNFWVWGEPHGVIVLPGGALRLSTQGVVLLKRRHRAQDPRVRMLSCYQQLKRNVDFYLCVSLHTTVSTVFV